MVKRIHSWILLLLLPVFLLTGMSLRPAPSLHPFYISVTEINHNAADKILEVSCKVFVDDMEETLKKAFHTPVDLSNAAQQERSGNYINQYVQQHLRLSVNGKAVPLQFVGFEKESESVYCYFEGGGVAQLKKLDADVSILQDLTTEQINILHVTAAGQRKSTKLNYPARNASFQF